MKIGEREMRTKWPKAEEIEITRGKVREGEDTEKGGRRGGGQSERKTVTEIRIERETE